MIEAIDITKYYGDFPAVTGLSFSVEQGEILGFLGPNGAGKSTLVDILLGLLSPDSGIVYVDDIDLKEIDKQIEAEKPEEDEMGDNEDGDEDF